MLNTSIQIMLKKSSSDLSTLFHLINLDLRCSTRKIIWAFWQLKQSIQQVQEGIFQGKILWDHKSRWQLPWRGFQDGHCPGENYSGIIIQLSKGETSGYRPKVGLRAAKLLTKIKPSFSLTNDWDQSMDNATIKLSIHTSNTLLRSFNHFEILTKTFTSFMGSFIKITRVLLPYLTIRLFR